MSTRARWLGWSLVAAAGAVAFVASFLLHTTPSVVTVRVDGHLDRVAGTMSTADYAALALRIGGPVLLVAGAYLAYRRLRPDTLDDAADAASGRIDRPVGAQPEAGIHTSRPASGFWGRGP